MIREMGTPASALPPDGQKSLSEFARTWANLSGRIGLSSSDRYGLLKVHLKIYATVNPKCILPWCGIVSYKLVSKLFEMKNLLQYYHIKLNL